MRLALLSPLPPEQTGIADYAENFRQALNQTGVEVSTPLRGRPSFDSMAAAQEWVANRDWSRVDIVHAELGGGRHSEFLALHALAGHRRRPALSATIHDPERMIWRPVNQLVSWMEARRRVPRPFRQAVSVMCDPYTLWSERQLAKQMDGLVTLTDTGATRLAARMRIAKTKVRVIPHGTMATPREPLPRTSPLHLLYFGFIYSGKGIEDLIEALNRLCQKEPSLKSEIRLTIAGGTAPEIAFGNQTSYLDRLKECVATCGLTDMVSWNLDVQSEDIAALIQRHHVMVLPYRDSRKLALLGQMRGTSGALAWAIACGRGVITSDARAFAEEISQGNGVSYPQGDVSALAGRLRELLSDRLLVKQWADQAVVLSDERVWHETGRRFLDHFNAVCQHHALQARRS